MSAKGKWSLKGPRIAQIEDDQDPIAADRAKIEMDIAKANAENDLGVRFARKSREVVEAELRRSTEALNRYANSISASEMDHLRLLVEKSKVEIEQAERSSRSRATPRKSSPPTTRQRKRRSATAKSRLRWQARRPGLAAPRRVGQAGRHRGPHRAVGPPPAEGFLSPPVTFPPSSTAARSS